MSKELTIFPKLPRTPGPGKGWADLRRDQDRECRLAHEKRFTDAELVAEWWRQDQVLFLTIDSARHVSAERRETVRRFAAAPHYFEETQL